MHRVLIPSDDREFIRNWVRAYNSLGWDVVTGKHNFEMRSAHYDVVHYQWPEEFSDWKVPSAEQIKTIKDHLTWWKHRSVNVFSVNNLYPHQRERDPACHALYSAFYEKCDLITHFSNASYRLVCEEFPAARLVRHVVHSPFNYEVALSLQKARGSCRVNLGIGDDEFVVLVFGRIRSWDEIRLIQKAFDAAGVSKKRLLMAGKLLTTGPKVLHRWRKLSLTWWLARRHAVVHTDFIPDDELYRFLDSSDAVIVPRISELSSALPGLAMTFGRLVIAPRHGSNPEYLAGTGNLLYESGDARSLAAAIEQAASVDRVRIGIESAKVAAKWTWKGIVQTCLGAIEVSNGGKGALCCDDGVANSSTGV